jgi:ligand-binding sensor domain-containing protein
MKLNPITLSFTEDDRYRDLYAKLPHVTVTSLFRDGEDHIWFGSWDKILYKQNAVTGKKEQYQSGTSYSFQDDEALSFAEDKWKRIWIGGKEKGLHVYDKRTNRFYNYRYNPSKEGGIADNRVNCIFIDRQGRAWLGTNRGISTTLKSNSSCNISWVTMLIPP